MSLCSGSVPEDTMASLAGRAKYDGPVCARVKNVQSNPVLPEGYCERLFQQDEDTYSMQSVSPSIAPLEYDGTINSSVPTATVTAPIGIISQESNTDSVGVLSSSSSESSKDQPLILETKQNKSSIYRKPNIKKSKRYCTVDNNTNGGFKKSLSPRDVIKEDEEDDIIPIEIPQTSPVHASYLYYCVFTYIYIQKAAPKGLRRLINKKCLSYTSRMYAAVQVLYTSFVTFMLLTSVL